MSIQKGSVLVSLAIAVTFIGGAVAQAAAVPLFGSADEIGHFDYAYQLWHGHLPDFYEGTVVDQLHGKTIPVQWVSQHPPLYYALMAPLIGPITDAGHILIAGNLARCVNIALGLFGVFSVVWAARQFVPSYPRVPLCAGMITASASWLHGVSGAIYNDTLAVIAGTIMLGLTAQILRKGPQPRTWWYMLIATCAAGLSRLSLLLIAFICLAAISIRGIILERRPNRFGRWGSLIHCFGIGLAVIATSGWFYFRNVLVSGSITGGHPEWSAEHLGRTEQPVSELAFSLSNWQKLLGIFNNNGLDDNMVFWLLIGLPALIFAIRVVVCSITKKQSLSDFTIFGFLSIVFIAVCGMQFVYSSGGGGLMPRYSLPIVAIIATIIALGITPFPLASIFLVPLWAIGAVFVRLIGRPVSPQGDHFPSFPGVSNASLIVFAVGIIATAIFIVTMIPFKEPTHRKQEL